MKFCTESDFNNNNCILSNSLIKIQWLNNIILVGDISYIYINTLITYNNELIISTYPYNENKTNEIYKITKFFGLKSNGRGYFYNKNSKLLETKKTSTSNIFHKEICEVEYLRSFDINEEGKYTDYYFIVNIKEQNFQLFDFERYKSSKVNLASFFGDNSMNKKFYIETSNLKNESLISIVGYKDNQYKLLFKGFSSSYNYSSKFTIYSYNSIRNIRNTGMSSCLRTKNDIFGCFYVTSQNIYSFSFLKFIYGNINLNKNPDILYTIAIDINTQSNEDLFYKCINLKDEIGVFI